MRLSSFARPPLPEEEVRPFDNHESAASRLLILVPLALAPMLMLTGGAGARLACLERI